MAERRVSIDFVAVVLSTLFLMVLVVLSLLVQLYALERRHDEHDRIERKVEQMIRAEVAERKAIERQTSTGR